MLAFGPPALIGYSDAIESEEPLSREKSRLTNRSVNSQEVERRRTSELLQGIGGADANVGTRPSWSPEAAKTKPKTSQRPDPNGPEDMP
jgi:hypothetical protein